MGHASCRLKFAKGAAGLTVNAKRDAAIGISLR